VRQKVATSGRVRLVLRGAERDVGADRVS
jgi:hypothetical protein